MDVRWLCLVYTVMLFSNGSRCVEREDNFTDFMHNYTNLKIFLWSGSGDGPDEPTEESTAATTKNPFYPESPEDCIGGQDCNIRPTSVAPHPGVVDVPQTAETPNEEYWIVTELNLRSPLDVNLSVPAIRTKLAVLYTIAFTRQRARHFGSDWTDDEADSYRTRRRGDSDGKPIAVDVHVLSVLNESDLVYFVAVDDRPVPAATAVRDMSLVTTQEVARHLGHAVRVKARPYVDASRPRTNVQTTNLRVWILVAVACAIVLALVAGIVVAHAKKRRNSSVDADATSGMAFRREHRTRNVKTEATSTDDMDNGRAPEPKPRNRNKTSDSLLTMQAVNTFQKNSIPGPLTDVLDDESNADDDDNKKKKYTRTLSRHESTCGQDPGVVGPVVWDLHCKRTATIKTSGRNNDNDDDDDDDSCASSDAFNAADANVTKMRQKFHQLLDDAFTLFGSRNSSARSDRSSSPSTSNDEQRSKSAPFGCAATPGGRPCGRPKTSADPADGRDDDYRLAASSCWAPSPGEAWAAGSDRSVFVARPLSAGPFHRPVLRAEFVSSDASLSPRDPAVPLIKAIRDELDKFPPTADSSRR